MLWMMFFAVSLYLSMIERSMSNICERLSIMRLSFNVSVSMDGELFGGPPIFPLPPPTPPS